MAIEIAKYFPDDWHMVLTGHRDEPIETNDRVTILPPQHPGNWLSVASCFLSGWLRFESSPRTSHNRVGPGLCRLIRQSKSETSSGSPVHLTLNPIDPLVTSLATNFITLLVTASKISEEPVVTGTTVELVLRIIIEDGFDASTG